LEKNNKFQANSRLKKKSDFLNLRSGAKASSDKFFRIYYKENNRELSRLGVSVSKKYGNAVARNKIKRIIKEIYRKNSAKNSSKDILVAINFNTINSKSFLKNKELFIKNFEKKLSGVGE